MKSRGILAVPTLAAACAGLALVLGARAGETLAAAAAGAAIMHALRALAGSSPAALVGAGAAALLAVALIVELPGSHALSQLAVAAAAWTIAELARQSMSPTVYVALAPAVAAALLEPGFVALIAIAGVRLVPGPKRWLIAVPIIGACSVALAVMAGVADGGTLGSLGDHWFRQPHTADDHTLWRVGDALGPLVTVAAIAGLATLARIHLASLAIVACAIGALLVDLRAGTPTAATLGLAALCAGAGIGRLAGMIRIREGQAIAAATFGFILVAPAVIERVL